MRRITIFAVLFTVFSTGAFAQRVDHYTISGGLLGGANVSTLSNDDVDFKNRFGFDAGIWANFPIGRVFSIEPQVMYSQRGYFSDVTDGTEPEVTVGYVSIPVFAKASFGKYFAVMAGPEFNIMTSAKDDNNNSGFENIGMDGWKKHSTSVTGGIEFAPHSRIDVYCRYNYGLVDLYRGDDGNPFSTVGDFKNQSIHFGIKFKLFGHKVMVQETEEVKPAPAPVVVAKPVDKDTDGDGIKDSKDKCPTVYGVAKYLGCPIPDKDGDGVNDEEDRCVEIVGIASNFGCPELVIYYKRDESNLDNNDKAELDKALAFVREHHLNYDIVIEGHTSTLGKDDYNLELSKKRAKNSLDYLVSKGVNPNRITTVGYGEQYPIGDNSTEEGRAQSRRIVIKFAK